MLGRNYPPQGRHACPFLQAVCLILRVRRSRGSGATAPSPAAARLGGMDIGAEFVNQTFGVQGSPFVEAFTFNALTIELGGPCGAP